MQITIVCAGKIKETYLKKGIEEYTKRLGGYCRLSVVEVADERTPDQGQTWEEERVRLREGERILSRVQDHQHVIVLDMKGKSHTSETFSSHLEKLGLAGKSNVVFIIGGSLGLSTDVLNRGNEMISFSSFTFPHQLMRLILLEQLYRAFRISRNEPYHK